jgi:hypothetical protein
MDLCRAWWRLWRKQWEQEVAQVGGSAEINVQLTRFPGAFFCPQLSLLVNTNVTVFATSMLAECPEGLVPYPHL